jgi:hypothetical protein
MVVGEWSFGPRVCDCFYFARDKGNNLQGLAVQAEALRTWCSLYPSSEKYGVGAPAGFDSDLIDKLL